MVTIKARVKGHMLGNRAKEKCDFEAVPTDAMFDLMKKIDVGRSF